MGRETLFDEGKKRGQATSIRQGHLILGDDIVPENRGLRSNRMLFLLHGAIVFRNTAGETIWMD